MNSEEHIQVDEWIARYQDGTLDGESLRKLTQWVSSSQQNRVYVWNRMEIWFSSEVAGSMSSSHKEEAYRRFMNRVSWSHACSAGVSGNNASELNWKQGRKSFSLSGRMFLRVAAVVLIVILPLAGYWSGKESLKGTFADISVEAPLGGRTKLYLPDGTLVWLNGGSKLVYSQGFGVEDRRLRMEGEGYFEVARNAEIPFEVQTNEVGLRVLGTKFNFRNYSDDEEVVVNLMEGKVSLHNEVKCMPVLYLEPNEKMVMNKLTGEMTKVGAKPHQSNAWVNGELLFDEDLLEDIAKRLARSYNVKVEVADSLHNERFYGSFIVRENTIEEVLSAMASTNQVRYRHENGKYILY